MDDNIRIKRLKYRSWHRGCKETDLVLGAFSDAKLSGLTAPMLALYEQFLDEDDANIWDWLTGKYPAPTHYAPIMALLKEDV